MKAKEKAKELIEKFLFEVKDSNSKSGGNLMFLSEAKQCALISVDEIINCDSFFKTLEDTKEFTKYWYNVQKEILSYENES